MNKIEFRRYLNRLGKKDHVIGWLVHSVENFESYLLEDVNRDLHSAVPEDIEEFANWLEETEKGSARKVVRGVAIYYAMIGNEVMRKTANEIREAGIAEFRREFLIREFRGMNEIYVEKLESTGIRNVKQMIAAGRTEAQRVELSQSLGIPLEVILEYVKLSDLARIEGVKGIRARLYYDAGVDTLDKLVDWDPVELRKMLVDYVERTQFNGIAPLPREISFTIAKAKKLKRLVEYE